LLIGLSILNVNLWKGAVDLTRFGKRKEGRWAARLVPLGVQGAADAFRLLRIAAVDLDVRVPAEEAWLFVTGDCDWFHTHCPKRIGLADEVPIVQALTLLHDYLELALAARRVAPAPVSLDREVNLRVHLCAYQAVSRVSEMRPARRQFNLCAAWPRSSRRRQRP
jgi:hypothetical protein